MWQRFTERARRVILLGQEEAGKMNSGHVGTEHLLLGLVRENEGVAMEVLQKMGVSLPKVRTEIEAEVQPGNDAGGSEPKLTPKAKRVLELAADEARRMRHNYIGTEHLLLALLREKDGLAATVLRRLGLNLEKARSQVMEYLGPDATPSSGGGKESGPEKPVSAGGVKAGAKAPKRAVRRLRRSTILAATSINSRRKANSIRSSGATRKSTAPSRFCAAAPKTIRFWSASLAWAKPRLSKDWRSAS